MSERPVCLREKQDRMRVILHASHCETVENHEGLNAPVVSSEKISLEACQSTKFLMQHTEICDQGKHCEFEHCFLTSRLKKHMFKCVHLNCLLCAPLRSLISSTEQVTLNDEDDLPLGDETALAKHEIVQYLLELLLHTLKCERRRASQLISRCELENCQAIQATIDHVLQCDEVVSCEFPDCVSLQDTLAHWNCCDMANCMICLPLKELKARLQGLSEPPGTNKQRELNLKKKKHCKRQISQLLHAYNCGKEDSEGGSEGKRYSAEHCLSANCKTIKEVIDHLPQCLGKDSCTFPDCSSLQRISSHWKNCGSNLCSACSASDGNRRKFMKTPLRGYTPVRCEEIQKTLMFLLHARHCKHENSCSVESCSHFKEVLKHIKTCEKMVHCDFKHCSYSRKILHHWKNCSRSKCAACFQIKDPMTPQSGHKQLQRPQQREQEEREEQEPPHCPQQEQQLWRRQRDQQSQQQLNQQHNHQLTRLTQLTQQWIDYLTPNFKIRSSTVSD